MIREAADPATRDDVVFRTRVAYALQDIEKFGSPIRMGSGLRSELTTLSATYPGLQNDRMRALMASTPDIVMMLATGCGLIRQASLATRCHPV